MNKIDRFAEIIATYRKHGWQLRRALLQPETRSEARGLEATLFSDVRIDEAPVDALWFSRSLHANREAWELRLAAETPYALFDKFEAGESEEEREEVRREMEARLREYVSES